MRSVLFLLIACFGLLKGFAQVEKGPYLFQEFTEAYVYYKDGRVFRVPINYNLIIGKFTFIDKDEQKKEFSDPDMVISVKVGNRSFLPVQNGGAAEVIQTEPKILVQYKGSTRKTKDIPYGGKTETASVETFSYLLSGTGASALDTENIILSSVDNEYHIEKDNRMRQFMNEKQFLKIFSKQKEQLKQYIDENKINFNTIEKVVKLCNYAFSLN